MFFFFRSDLDAILRKGLLLTILAAFNICYDELPCQRQNCLHMGAADWVFPNPSRGETPNTDGLERRCRPQAKRIARRRYFKQFLPLIVRESMKPPNSWQIKWMLLERCQGHSGNIGNIVVCVSQRHGCRKTIWTSKSSNTNFRPCRQTTEGGGITMLLDNRWCNPGHVTVKEHLCTPHI